MKVITLVGNLTKDAESRTTKNGDNVCGFSLAVNDRKANQAYFFDCSYWGKRGDAVCPYLTKGKQVTVIGDFSWREYNNNKYLEVQVQSLQLGKNSKESSKDQNEQNSQSYDQRPESSPRDLDDEIPF